MTFVAWLVSEWSMPTIVLVCLAVGPTIELGNWEGAARLASLRYDRDESDITVAYNAPASLIGALVISAIVLAEFGLGAGGLKWIPDSGVVLFVLLPIAAYLIADYFVHWSSIRRAAAEHGWKKRRKSGDQ